MSACIKATQLCAAINGDHADNLILLDHRHENQGSDAAELDRGNRHRLAVEVRLLCTHICDVDRLPGPDGAGHGVSSAYVKHSSVPLLRRECRWHRTVERNAADGFSFAEP